MINIYLVNYVINNIKNTLKKFKNVFKKILSNIIIMDNSIILQLINKQKEDLKNNRCCKYCGVKIDVRRSCIKCTLKINNFKLQQKNYFKSYYETHKKPVAEPKKRGRKPKPKQTDNLEEEEKI
jgi:hypothetical protein